MKVLQRSEVGLKQSANIVSPAYCFHFLTFVSQQLLDKMLGKGHVALFRRAELKTLVNMHGNEVEIASLLLFPLSGLKGLQMSLKPIRRSFTVSSGVMLFGYLMSDIYAQQRKVLVFPCM